MFSFGSLTTLRNVISVTSVINQISVVTLSSLPRRVKPAPQSGASLGLSPSKVGELMDLNSHALSKELCDSEGWEFFSWKGQELSAPLRALWIAEELGLYQKVNDQYQPIEVAKIVDKVNAYLIENGKAPVTEGSILSNLNKAAKYLNVAFGVALIPSRKDLTVRIANGIETQENIDKFFEQIKTKVQKLNDQIEHAAACNFEIKALTGLKADAIKQLAGSY